VLAGSGEICGSRKDPWKPLDESTMDSDVDSDNSSDTRLEAMLCPRPVGTRPVGASALQSSTSPLLLQINSGIVATYSMVRVFASAPPTARPFLSSTRPGGLDAKFGAKSKRTCIDVRAERLTKDDLVAYLASGCKPRDAWRIGTEHEKLGT